jgi:NAD+-dependent farnesol dehydrogenase
VLVKVLVTGGTGYLGGAIVRALSRRGHQPVVFARRASPAERSSCVHIRGDVTDRPALVAAVRGVDAVCHTAALVSIWQPDPADFDRVNVGGLETVIDVCSTLGIPRVIYTSSFLALPPRGRTRALEANDYQRSKVRAREVARAAARRGMPIVTLIPGVIYGPGADTEGNLVGRLIRDHLAGRLPGIVGADRLWSFSFIDDVADAHVSALEDGEAGAEYVVGGDNLPQVEAFRLVSIKTGTAPPRRIPGYVATALAWMAEVSARRGTPPSITRGTVKILQHDWPLDSARSVQLLSYRMTPLSTGILSLFDAVS